MHFKKYQEHWNNWKPFNFSSRNFAFFIILSFFFSSRSPVLKAELAKGGYDKYSAYDLGWQSLHMAAAAACRGSTATGGTGSWENSVTVIHNGDNKTCAQLCASTPFSKCDAQVAIYGTHGKATKNGQSVGFFYNYSCNTVPNGGSEVSSSVENIMNFNRVYFNFCCCRK